MIYILLRAKFTQPTTQSKEAGRGEEATGRRRASNVKINMETGFLAKGDILQKKKKDRGGRGGRETRAGGIVFRSERGRREAGKHRLCGAQSPWTRVT